MVDGMSLMKHPGPKGQMLRTNGEVEYFCDIRELFETHFNAETAKQFIHTWVQSFNGREWSAYNDGWIRVEDAFYVFDSEKEGAMGPTIIPFLTRQQANHFISENGGYALPYKSITTEVIENYAKKIREQFRKQTEEPSHHHH